MLTLMLLPAHNPQMDWSIKASDEAKSEEAQRGGDLQHLPHLQQTSQHVQESLERMSLARITPTADGFYQQYGSPRAFIPYVRPVNTTAIPITPASATYCDNVTQDPSNVCLPSTSAAALRQLQLSQNVHSTHQPHLPSYGTINVSPPVSDRLQTTPGLTDNVQEEPPGITSANRESISPLKRNSTNVLDYSIASKKAKQPSPPLVIASTDVDIEAQLPCTSIEQRLPPGPAKKSGRSRNNGSNTIPKPRPPRKQSSIRSSKKQTNYCENSTDDEEIKTVNSRNKSAFQPIKSEPAKKDNNTIVKPTESQVFKPTPTAVDPATIIANKATDVQFSPEPSKEDIKTDLLSQPTSTSSTPSMQHEPRTKKQRRVRNPAVIAAAAKNKTKLYPLTRKEQMIMNKLIESKQPFLQNLPCLKLSSRISKCRECRCASLRSDSMFCRFYDFRRLRFKDKAVLIVDGFSDPHKDPGQNDINLWMPPMPPKDMDLDICRFILMHVGDQFCRIWQEEQKAINEHMSKDNTIAWKKVVKGVREICDVCETTLFNYHWTCNRCGFGVCIDCYRDRRMKLTKKVERPAKGYDDYGWFVCTFREAHDQTTLMLTQIIPGNALNYLAQRLHEVCRVWKIPQKCNCPLYKSMQQVTFAPRQIEIADKIIKDAYLRNCSREAEIKYREKIKRLDIRQGDDQMELIEAETALIEEARAAGSLPVILATTLKHLKYAPLPGSYLPPTNTDHLRDSVTKEYYAAQTRSTTQKYLPQKIMTSRMSFHLFPAIEHDWLCNGKLLRLLNSRITRNVKIFQEVWKRGQPVMVSELCKFLNISLWHPEAFCRDFGEKKNDLINCMTGNLVPNQPMKYFWEGFQCVSKRLLDAHGEPMLLKLKDWPPGDDFAEILPTRFADLMSALPLPEYTLRTGCLNIASRLPNIFVPPDLGPKMYNAYGSALHPDKGTTNLHLDISDAVNIMVYVGIPTDASAKEQIKAALRAIDGSGCDIIMRRRAREPDVMPGALWHIYAARDADKIRDLLNRVTIERGYRLEPDHDPIHDQNWYLDNELRERLYDDYGVEGYPIVQCLGDAVFIPAGAPHQVRNLHNCIKVAEDFVSPENIEHCFHLSQQFRKLSMSHTNHEDKLQIRNVIYHVVKDTTSYLVHLLNRQV